MLLRCYCGATALALRWRCGCRAAPRRPRGGYIWDVVFGRITVFAAAEDVATVITVIIQYYCCHHLVMPPKRATTGRTVGLGKARMKTPTPTSADAESSHDEHDDGVMPPKRATT